MNSVSESSPGGTEAAALQIPLAVPDHQVLHVKMLGRLAVICEAAPSCVQSFSKFLCSLSLALCHTCECIWVHNKEERESKRCM